MTIRFGVVGTNWITDRFLESGLENEDFLLTAVYSRSEEKGKAFAAKYAGASVYTDLEAMAASDEIDAVYIASPNSLHAEHALICINHGKHVLCEKPAASNAAELRSVIEAARRNNVLFMEAMKSTLVPGFNIIKENLYKIGRVRRYFASYCQYSSRYDAFLQGTVLNAFNPAYSNGALMDLGVYCLYPMVVLFGKPDTVKATGVMLSSGVDGEGSIVMRYGDMDAVVMYAKITESYLPAEIQGENGTMIIDKISQPYEVKIRYRDGIVEELTVPQTYESMYYEAEEFIRLVKAGEHESSVNSHANSLATAEIMEDARRQLGLRYASDQW
ncbi:Gfo/Idh/MocA family protein [Paenibacillus sabinae]|uniref:Oxidoreductase n=1 Tax=Paenibacillus sabinae T27 TaxID=1268072 RepID=X4Z7Z2_9BACL|nr:Gfo/Idh/MocA family oxidoreductase [Paenibacillus sabinae]AHV95816.1 oxidoreductase [Paenibacillus sabinae T27]